MTIFMLQRKQSRDWGVRLNPDNMPIFLKRQELHSSQSAFTCRTDLYLGRQHLG